MKYTHQKAEQEAPDHSPELEGSPKYLSGKREKGTQ